MDDMKGIELSPELARRARREELEVFMERGVYEVVPRSDMKKGSKLIGIRWVETDKGTPGKPKVRSRLVCQEFAKGSTPEEMFDPLHLWLRRGGCWAIRHREVHLGPANIG